MPNCSNLYENKFPFITNESEVSDICLGPSVLFYHLSRARFECKLLYYIFSFVKLKVTYFESEMVETVHNGQDEAMKCNQLTQETETSKPVRD